MVLPRVFIGSLLLTSMNNSCSICFELLCFVKVVLTFRKRSYSVGYDAHLIREVYLLVLWVDRCFLCLWAKSISQCSIDCSPPILCYLFPSFTNSIDMPNHNARNLDVVVGWLDVVGCGWMLPLMKDLEVFLALLGLNMYLRWYPPKPEARSFMPNSRLCWILEVGILSGDQKTNGRDGTQTWHFGNAVLLYHSPSFKRILWDLLDCKYGEVTKEESLES